MKKVFLLSLLASTFVLYAFSGFKTDYSSSIFITPKPSKSETEQSYKYKYTEQGCVVGSCIGKKCFTTNGNCKKAKTCTAVPGGCVSPAALNLDDIAIYAEEDADWMLSNDYIDAEDWEASYDLCYQLLVDRMNGQYDLIQKINYLIGDTCYLLFQ